MYWRLPDDLFISNSPNPLSLTIPLHTLDNCKHPQSLSCFNPSIANYSTLSRPPRPPVYPFITYWLLQHSTLLSTIFLDVAPEDFKHRVGSMCASCRVFSQLFHLPFRTSSRSLVPTIWHQLIYPILSSSLISIPVEPHSYLLFAYPKSRFHCLAPHPQVPVWQCRKCLLSLIQWQIIHLKLIIFMSYRFSDNYKVPGGIPWSLNRWAQETIQSLW